MSTPIHARRLSVDPQYVPGQRGPRAGAITRKLKEIATEKGSTLNYLRNVFYAKGKINGPLFAELCGRLHASGAITGEKLEELRAAAKPKEGGAG